MTNSTSESFYPAAIFGNARLVDTLVVGQRIRRVVRNKKCDNRGHRLRGIAGITYTPSQPEFLNFNFCNTPESVATCTNT